MEGRRHNAVLAWVLLIPACAILFWFAPLFHLVPLQAARAETSNAAFNASAFVEKFWTDRLLKSFDKTTDAATLLAALKHDPKAARAKYSRSVGLSDTAYYYVSGAGRIVSVTNDSVSISLTGGASPDIILTTGNIFGNAARDATGLLDINDYPNSRDFNDIAAEINRRIEERILPNLRAHAKIGATIQFTGCAEVSNDAAELSPLTLVPLRAEFP